MTPTLTPPPEAAQRTNDDRTHSFVGSVAFQLPTDYKRGTTMGNILRDVGVFATFRVQSGLPFTMSRLSTIDTRSPGRATTRFTNRLPSAGEKNTTRSPRCGSPHSASRTRVKGILRS